MILEVRSFFARSMKEGGGRFSPPNTDKISEKVIADLDRNTYNLNSI